jgi:hypothetical protein
VVGPPIEPVAGSPFYGRHEALNWVATNLYDQAHPATLIVYGQRRTGKTSLLLQLEHLGRSKTTHGKPACYVYVDLQKVDTGVEYFLLELAERAQKALRGRGLAHLTPLSPEDFRAGPYRTFDRFLDAAEKLLDGGKLIFLLDEFELLSSTIAGDAQTRGLFNYIRSLIEHRSSIAFVLAGASPDRIAPTPESRTLMAVSRVYELTYLDRDQTVRLIREPVQPVVQYEDNAVEAIWTLTHGHPYFTQAVCYQLITLLNDRKRLAPITREDVEEAVGRILKEGNVHMSNLWDELSPDEQIVMTTLSDRAEFEPGPATLREIQEWCQRCIVQESIMLALGRLTERHLIEAMPKRLLNAPPEEAYRLTMELMGRWASRKHPLGALLRQLARVPVEVPGREGV